MLSTKLTKLQEFSLFGIPPLTIHVVHASLFMRSCICSSPENNNSVNTRKHNTHAQKAYSMPSYIFSLDEESTVCLPLSFSTTLCCSGMPERSTRQMYSP